MKRPRLVLLISSALVLAGLTTVWLQQGRSEVTYLSAPVQRGDVRTVITATGTLNAVVTVKVGSQLSGQIAELLVDFNDEVEQGQALAELDSQTYAARVREAEAALQVARSTVAIQRAAVDKAAADVANARASRAVTEARAESARIEAEDAERELAWRRTLLERATIAASEVERALAEARSALALRRAAKAELHLHGSAVRAAEAGRAMAEADLQHAHAAVQQQEAALDQAEVDLARTVIRAPIDGVVVGRDVDRGQTVAATLEAPTLFTIAQDLRRMEVHAKADEADIGRIRVGQPGAFTVDAHPGREFAGAVAQIRKAPEVIQNVVTYTVLISAENPELELLPGMTAVVQIVVDEVADVLTVPNAALRFRPPEDAVVSSAAAGTADQVERDAPALVWKVDGAGPPAPVRVGLGESDANATELTAGPLTEGDRVIVGAAPRSSESWFAIRFGL
jgi:HlyD family secretion protein